MDGSRHYQLWRRWSKASGCETPAGQALLGVDKGDGNGGGPAWSVSNTAAALPGDPGPQCSNHRLLWSAHGLGFHFKQGREDPGSSLEEGKGTCGRCHGGLTFSYPSEVLDVLHGLSRPWLPSCLIFCFRKWPLLLWSIHDV